MYSYLNHFVFDFLIVSIILCNIPYMYQYIVGCIKLGTLGIKVKVMQFGLAAVHITYWNKFAIIEKVVKQNAKSLERIAAYYEERNLSYSCGEKATGANQ